MQQSNRSAKSIHELQNKFRGILSEFRSRRFVAGDRNNPHQVARKNLKKVLLEARAELPVRSFDEFLNWLSTQERSQLHELESVPINFDELSGLFDTKVISLNEELQWLASLYTLKASTINQMLDRIRVVEARVLSGELDTAISELNSFDTKFGVSLWTVQLRISLEQLSHGLERQKIVTAELRNIYQRGLLRFISYQSSVRNEDKTTFGKFKEDVENRLASHKYFEDDTKVYLQFRLNGQFPDSEEGLASILRIDQSHSLFDIYETTIATLQHAVKLNLRTETIDEILIFLNCILNTDIYDPRIQKLHAHLSFSSGCTTLPKRDRSISDNLFHEQYKSALLQARKSLRESKQPDIWQIIYAGISFAHSKKISLSPYRNAISLAKLIGLAVGNLDSENYEIHDLLEKISQNLRPLPFAAGLIEFIDLLRRSEPNSEWRFWAIGLHSPTAGIEDVQASNRKQIQEIRLTDSSLTAKTWTYFLSEDDYFTETRSIASSLFSSLRLINDRNFEDAINELSYNPEQFKFVEPMRRLWHSALLHAHFSLDHRKEVIELVASEGVRSENLLSTLPIRATLEYYEWRDYQGVDGPFAAAIALHFLWQLDEKDATASMLRFAVSKSCEKLLVSKPSELDAMKNTAYHSQAVYFLRYICLPNILDGSRLLQSSREVLEERREICSLLCLIDPKNEDYYRGEIALITHSLVLEDGKYIVDRTRIHVDLDALKRWGEREVAEDFRRYQDLSALDIGSKQNFDDVLIEMKSTGSYNFKPFEPESEADAVLYGMLRRVGDEFLTNSTFGLDFYLSKRIRHQSFIGLIRGPLEFSNLITTRKSSSGNYYPNTHWLEHFSSCDPGMLLEISSALEKFSLSFDNLLADAKDHRFHVRTESKPRGLVSLELNDQIVTLIKATIEPEDGYRSFIEVVLATLWPTLRPSLIRTQRFISQELKSNVANLFDELRASVSRIVGTGSLINAFDIAVGNCATDVQRALDEASVWFSRTDELELLNERFSLLQAVEISTDTALKCQRSFEPKIQKNVIGESSITAASLVFIHDFFYVAISNARSHSGLKHPTICFCVEADTVREILKMEAECNVKIGTKSKNQEKLHRIRQKIETGDIHSRTREEGETGFLKLAAVVGQSKKGELSFKFLGEEHFHLSATYSLVSDFIEDADDLTE